MKVNNLTLWVKLFTMVVGQDMYEIYESFIDAVVETSETEVLIVSL